MARGADRLCLLGQSTFNTVYITFYKRKAYLPNIYVLWRALVQDGDCTLSYSWYRSSYNAVSGNVTTHMVGV